MQYELNIKGEKYRITLETLSSKQGENEPSLADIKHILEFITLPKAPHYTQLENIELETTASRQILAPLPGTIIHVGIKTGEVVQKGDLLMVLEAMKMENEIYAPCSGLVTEVLTKIGKTVKAKEILVVLE